MKIEDQLNNIDFSEYLFHDEVGTCTPSVGSSTSERLGEVSNGLLNKDNYLDLMREAVKNIVESSDLEIFNSKSPTEPKQIVQNNEQKYRIFNTNDVADQSVFFTLNSWKKKSRFEYNKIIKQVINRVNHNKKMNMVAQWYFEDKKVSGEPTRLHVHGMLNNVSLAFYPYEGLNKYISAQFHAIIGKPRLKHSICAKVEWSRSNENVARYCKKFNKSRNGCYLCPKL